MKNIAKFAALFMVLVALVVFVACDGADTETSTDLATTPVTEADVTVSPDTVAPETLPPETQDSETIAPETNESATDAPETSEPATSEPETEATDEPVPEEAPDNNRVLTFFDTPKNEELFTNKQTALEIVADENGAPVLKLSTSGSGNFRDPYAKLNYAAYMDYAGLSPMAWNDCAYAVVSLKVENVKNTKFEIVVYASDGDKTVQSRGTASYSKTSTDWQTVLVPIVELQRDGVTVEDVRIDFVDSAGGEGETVYIRSISFTSDKMEAFELTGKQLIKPQYATVTIPGLTEEYKFLHITDTHVSAFSEEDRKAWTTTRYNYNVARRNSFAAEGLLAEERFPALFDYADEIGASGMFLTGDLIDFPSEKNIALLYENATRTQAKPIFCLGNHDWNFADDYMTQNAVLTYMPRFAELTGGDPQISVAEYDAFMVVAIDNSSDVVTDATVQKFLALYEKNKPIILLLHVPLHADTLAPDVKKAWGGRNITMGPGAMGSDWGSVQQFYNAVCVAEDTPVVAVFAGHVHFNHEDVFPNGVPQYVTSTGYTGDCRVVTVKGEEAGA